MPTLKANQNPGTFGSWTDSLGIFVSLLALSKMVSPESGILKLDDPDRDRCDDRDFCVVVSAVSYFGAQQRAEIASWSPPSTVCADST